LKAKRVLLNIESSWECILSKTESNPLCPWVYPLNGQEESSWSFTVEFLSNSFFSLCPSQFLIILNQTTNIEQVDCLWLFLAPFWVKFVP
jgi:hypothetical protein